MSAYYPYQYDDPAMAADPYASDVDRTVRFLVAGLGLVGQVQAPVLAPVVPLVGLAAPVVGLGLGLGPRAVHDGRRHAGRASGGGSPAGRHEPGGACLDGAAQGERGPEPCVGVGAEDLMGA